MESHLSATQSPRLRLTISWPVFVPLLAALAFAAALMGGTSSAGSSGITAPSAADMASGTGAVSLDLASVATREPGRRVEVIVQLQPGVAPDLAAARIAATGGHVMRPIPLINGLAADMTAGAAAVLADLPGVRAVSLNAKVVSTGRLEASKVASAYLQAIRADKAWAGGYTGKGVGVAVIDSGLDGSLADFRGSDGKSRGIASAVVHPGSPDAKDGYGHGTHVSGLIAGNGFNRDATDPLYGKYSGVAPDANIIAIKADDGRGNTDVLALIDGLHFAVTHAAEYNIRIVNMSVRTESTNSYKTDPLNAAVEALWKHGIIVVAAAGNLGDQAGAVDHAPGNDPFAITVGAVDDKSTKGIEDDELASWSSRGVTRDGFAKPDILAPGSKMVAPLARGSAYTSIAPSTSIVEGGQYVRLGGTSMAAGVVSGAIATVIQAHPEWTPDQVKATITKRSRKVSSDDGDVGKALALDKVLYTNGGRPEAPANQGIALNNLVDPATGTINAKDESWAASSWGASSWGASSWGASSWGASSWGAAPEAWVADWARASWSGISMDPAEFDAGNPQDCWQLARTVASSWGASSWGASSWGASSWGASSWGASSWGATSWATSWDK